MAILPPPDARYAMDAHRRVHRPAARAGGAPARRSPNRRAGAESAEARRLENDAQASADLLQELEWFEAELRKTAERGYAPDRDDGVIINMAPLHARAMERTGEGMDEAGAGRIHWAKLAMRYWPDRVRAKCAEDRSLAIAHRLDR